ncbi:helicase domain-containing protein, partial [Candidatus Magnetoovum chiemensis]
EISISYSDQVFHFLCLDRDANKENDPKLAVVRKCLLERKWLDIGCIIFSQYYDSIEWLAEQLSKELPDELIGIYAGGNKSGLLKDRHYASADREKIKKFVKDGQIRLLLGTDAASEGLNLQRLGTLINLDLPWNPTRLEQRKGRIQRIGQIRDVVHIYNLRYKDSVEDKVHGILSDRLENIHTLFGQIPDVLEDVWIDIAVGDIEKAKLS